MKTRRGKRSWLATAVVAIAIGGTAASVSCSRQAHIRDDFGVQTRQFFDRQAGAAEKGDSQGLDSEEASLIHQSYRKNMGSPSGPTRSDPRSSVLILEDGDAPRRQR